HSVSHAMNPAWDRAIADFSTQPQVVAVAGIARPEAFFAMLEAAGLVLARRVALPDHHDFEARPVALSPQDCVLCTEKDAVKLWRRSPQAWAVPLSLEIEPAFWAAFDGLLEAKLSSRDGSQTA
ncbi:MAG: tetraacyldisaccharide 4'-kinase, partial [Pseudomonadota bacterium]